MKITTKDLEPIFKKVLEIENIDIQLSTVANDIPEWDSLNHIYLVVEIEKVFNKKFTAHHDNKFLNIEYNDFNSSQTLIECLQHLPTFYLSRFDTMYELLCNRNSRYLTRQQQFLSKLNSQAVDFDILEWAYIGVLLYWQDGIILDWFNVRYKRSKRIV